MSEPVELNWRVINFTPYPVHTLSTYMDFGVEFQADSALEFLITVLALK